MPSISNRIQLYILDLPLFLLIIRFINGRGQKGNGQRQGKIPQLLSDTAALFFHILQIHLRMEILAVIIFVMPVVKTVETGQVYLGYTACLLYTSRCV